MGEPGRVERWAGILVPAGFVTAVLYYFGYASTRAKYAYFGIDVDAVGLGTPDFLMRSPNPLLVPLVLLAVLALLINSLHLALHRRIQGAPDEDSTSRQKRLRLIRRSAVVGVISGVLLLVGGVLFVLIYPLLYEWPAYDMITPIGFMIGAALVSYGWHVRRSASNASTQERSSTADMPSKSSRRVVWILYAIVIVGSVFWATSTLAEWSGRGQAVTLAAHFKDLPNVILDTTEHLYPRDPAIQETTLPPEDAQTFRYRYRGLRLLVEGGGRMFLVPDEWSNSGSTLVVPMDDSVRVRFQFQNPG